MIDCVYSEALVSSVAAGASADSLASGAASPEGSVSEEVQRVCDGLLVIDERNSGASRNTYQVVAKELHDEGGVLVALLAEGVELGDGIVEGSLGEVASLVGRVQDLVVEDGEVKSKSETDGVGGGEVGLGNLGGVLVSLERLVGGGLALVTKSELGEVTVVITLPVRRISGATLLKSSSGLRTSCGRRPWTRRSGQRG